MFFSKFAKLKRHEPLPEIVIEGLRGSAVAYSASGHWSDCAVHNAPALPVGPCDCGGYDPEHEGPAHHARA